MKSNKQDHEKRKGAESSETAGSEFRRVTLWGLGVNLLLTAGKFLLGVLGQSQALVADSVHSLSDSVTDVTILVGERFWSAPPDEAHPYGHGRIETIITFLIGIALGAVGIGLAYDAVASLRRQDFGSPGWLAFVGACISIAVKEGLYQWNIRVGRRIRSFAMLANAWHHRSDAMSSAPVAIAVIGSRIWPDWGFLDQVATVIVAVLILYAAWEIARPALERLIDVGAASNERQQILAIARETPGVESVHGLRTRYVGPGLFVDLHVLVNPDLSVHHGHEIAKAVKWRLVESGPEIIDVLVHIEPYERDTATS